MVALSPCPRLSHLDKADVEIGLFAAPADDAAHYFAHARRVDALAKAAAMASGQAGCVEMQ